MTSKHKDLLIHFLIIITFFILCLFISQGWNQFYPIGERIRDYALLIEQQKNLFGSDEPWMSGTSAHYYLFWYKIGGFIGKIFNLRGEHTYLTLLNFCWTLYFSVIYFFNLKILKLTKAMAAVIGVLILFSSNWAGITFGLTDTRDWWHVSRVIEGAITEFPAWSYLLGDLHPHLMNLALPPLFLFLGFKLLEKNYVFKEKIIGLAILCLLFVSVFLSANPWDSIAIAVVGGFIFLAMWFARSQNGTEKISRVAIAIASITILTFLILKPEMKAHAMLRFVQDPIERTPILSFLQHWGWWILLIAVASGFLLYEKTLKSWWKKYWIIAASTVSSWLLPEIVFLDDAYTFPNERMNFIFKIYSFSWVFTGLWFASLLSVLSVRKSWVIVFVALVPSLLFFHKARQLRLEELQMASHPLDIADRNYAGAKLGILKFRELPDGLTIQSAAAAYDYTSFIATMSDKKLYLGWPNHMSLLNGDYGSVNERIQVITSLYLGTDCELKKQKMQGIGARYLVLSAQEFKDYPQINHETFSCFKKVIDEQTIRVLSF